MSDLTNLSDGSTVAGCCTTGSCGHADGAGEMVRLRALLNDVDALHERTVIGCRECNDQWPCETHRLIHPEEARK